MILVALKRLGFEAACQRQRALVNRLTPYLRVLRSNRDIPDMLSRPLDVDPLCICNVVFTVFPAGRHRRRCCGRCYGSSVVPQVGPDFHAIDNKHAHISIVLPECHIAPNKQHLQFCY